MPRLIATSFFKNFLANSLGQVVTIVMQLVLVPFFLSAWGAERYGTWLAIVSLPLLMAYSDFGFGTVFANNLAIQVNRKEAGSNMIFWTGFSTVTALALFIMILLLLALGSFSELMTVEGARAIFVTMAGYAMAGLLCTYLTNCSKAVDKYHSYMTYHSLIRGAEVLGVLIALVLEKQELFVASVFFGVRLTGACLMFALISRGFDIFRFRHFDFSVALLRKNIRAAVTFVLFPVSLALFVQIPILILERHLGAAVVTAFVVTRTIARVPLQFSNVITASLWPIITKSFATGDSERTNAKLMASSTVAIAVFFGLFTLVTLFLGKYFFAYWTAGEVAFEQHLFLALAAQSLISAIWLNRSVELTATNRHELFCIALFVIYVAALAISAVMMPVPVTTVVWLYVLFEVVTLLMLHFTINIERSKAL